MRVLTILFLGAGLFVGQVLTGPAVVYSRFDFDCLDTQWDCDYGCMEIAACERGCRIGFRACIKYMGQAISDQVCRGIGDDCKVECEKEYPESAESSDTSTCPPSCMCKKQCELFQHRCKWGTDQVY